MATLDQKTTESLIGNARSQAEKLAKSIRTNQVRNFYSGIIRIKQKYETEKKWTPEIETQVHMLKPALAYAAGRQNAVKPFKDFIEPEIEALLNSSDKEKALEKFFVLIESFIAYHKFYGGKD
ncbi:MAG TPA: type III-A CRISPR-associated protein Csm2 [Chitinophagales bacterium]|nr:type III-A CRISPR-associated protein Csm2 [Chitinophagales bacterium]